MALNILVYSFSKYGLLSLCTLPVILGHIQTAVCLVTSVLNCQGEIRKEHVVVVMTGIEDEEVEREGEEEEARPTEDDGKLINTLQESDINVLIKHCFLISL